MIDTILRFPLTIVLLVAASIMNVISTSNVNYVTVGSTQNELFSKLFVAFLLGALVSVVGQMTFERFFKEQAIRYVYMGSGVLSSLVYYIAIKKANLVDVELGIRTIVIFFILIILFIWIPVINNRYHFNQSFMAVFKAFFTSIFFTGVLYLGIAMLLGAINLLITKLNGQIYLHSATIIFVILAPIYLLSLIPNYYKEDEDSEHINRLLSPSKFLEALISYIIIPITIAFTAILLIYIVMNITGEFWTDNLMEPLLVAYSLTVIVVYLLTCCLQSAIAKYFRLIFPKILIPVVLFQTVASVLKINEVGVTYGRYYVILFGVFAIIVGVLFSILPLRKNGIIAPILIALSLVAIIPPVDAFTVSTSIQVSRLKEALQRNDILKDDKIIGNKNVALKDQNIISSSITYLDQMNDTKRIKWLTAYTNSNNFKETFGFDQYGGNSNNNYKYINVSRDENTPISVDGYDYLVRKNLNSKDENVIVSNFKQDGKEYSIKVTGEQNNRQIVLEQNGQIVVSFELNQIIAKFKDSSEKSPVSSEEVTFTSENNAAVLTLIANNININEYENEDNKELFVDLYILLDIK